MLDFASALYLGFHHASRELRPWPQFTTGVPAALGSPQAAQEVARGLAAMQGCERSTLAPSTLHLFWDFFGVLAEQRPVIFLDDGTYPIARWGVERAVGRGARVASFRHQDARALRQAFAARRSTRGRPVIVTDGFCPSCGRPAPLAEYLEVAREADGLLVIDDTQALGIFGESPGPGAPYGRGGGGMLRHTRIGGPEVVLASSMAKAFGVPLAALSGSAALIKQFEAQSESRVHCSPPSIATLHAAEHALRRNRDDGDAIRLRLARLVQFFRARILDTGLAVTGGLFPVQTLVAASGLDLMQVHGRLLQSGIRSVLRRSRHSASPCLSLLITARRTIAQLNWTVDTLLRIARLALGPILVSR